MTSSIISLDTQSKEFWTVLSAYPDGTLKIISVYPSMNVAQLFMDVCQRMYLIPSNYAYQVFVSKFPPTESLVCSGCDKVKDLNISYIRLIPRIFINEGYNSLFAFQTKQINKNHITVIDKLTGISMSLEIDIETTVQQLTLKVCQIFNLTPSEDYRLLHPTKPNEITFALHYPFVVYGLNHVVISGTKIMKKCRKLFKKITLRKNKANKCRNRKYDNDLCKTTTIDDSMMSNCCTNEKSFSVNLSSRQEITKLSNLLPAKKKRAPSPPINNFATPNVSTIVMDELVDNKMDNLSENKLTSITNDFEEIESNLEKKREYFIYDEYTFTPNICDNPLSENSDNSEEFIDLSSINLEVSSINADTIPRYSTTLPRDSNSTFMENSLTNVFKCQTLKEFRKKHIYSDIVSHERNPSMHCKQKDSVDLDENNNSIKSNYETKSISSNDESLVEGSASKISLVEPVFCSLSSTLSRDNILRDDLIIQPPQMAKSLNSIRTTLKFLMPKPYNKIIN